MVDSGVLYGDKWLVILVDIGESSDHLSVDNGVRLVMSVMISNQQLIIPGLVLHSDPSRILVIVMPSSRTSVFERQPVSHPTHWSPMLGYTCVHACVYLRIDNCIQAHVYAALPSWQGQ